MRWELIFILALAVFIILLNLILLLLLGIPVFAIDDCNWGDWDHLDSLLLYRNQGLFWGCLFSDDNAATDIETRLKRVNRLKAGHHDRVEDHRVCARSLLRLKSVSLLHLAPIPCGYGLVTKCMLDILGQSSVSLVVIVDSCLALYVSYWHFCVWTLHKLDLGPFVILILHLCVRALHKFDLGSFIILILHLCIRALN